MEKGNMIRDFRKKVLEEKSQISDLSLIHI